MDAAPIAAPRLQVLRFDMKIVADMNIPFVSECFSSIGQVEVVSSSQINSKVVSDADILLVRSVTKVNPQLLDGSKIKFVGTATIGFEHVDLEYLNSRGIGFASAPGSNANSVAEYIVAGLLYVAQKYGIELEGKSIGIVGCGNVGSRVAQKAHALGMELFLNDPPLKRQTSDKKYLPIGELFDCDFLTVHTPLTFSGPDKTFHLMDENFFRNLKKDCIFFNTSRGAVVDGASLKKALQIGRLRASVLDVWENEPDIDLELLEMVDIGTPHIAGYSMDGKVAGMMMIYKAVCDYFDIKPVFGQESFLSGALSNSLSLPGGVSKEQSVLNDLVKKVYDIKKDDLALRKIIDLPADHRAEYFYQLRKEYPIRMEFQNVTVILGNGYNNLADKLRGIGFKIR
jgi:erythronate-4-phosphate dehydrogenase